MKSINFLTYLLLISSLFLNISIFFYSEDQKIYTIDNLISGTYKIEDIINKDEQFIYNLLKYEKKSFEFDQYIENLNINSIEKKIQIEIDQKDFYSKSIFSNNLILLYKESYSKEKIEIEKFTYMGNYYLFQKFSNSILKEEKKLKILDNSFILFDVLPLALRIFIANKGYEKIEKINIILGFLQSKYKVPFTICFRKINSFDQLNLDIDKSNFNKFHFESSILCELINNDIMKVFKFKIIYLFSSLEPYYQKFVYFGNKSNYYIIYLDKYKSIK